MAQKVEFPIHKHFFLYLLVHCLCNLTRIYSIWKCLKRSKEVIRSRKSDNTMAERKSTQKTDNGSTRIPLRIGVLVW